MNASRPVPEAPDWSADLADFVACVDWSPDGQWLVAAGSSGPLWRLSASTGAMEERWAGHEEGTFRAVCSPREARIASVGQDGHLRLWAPGVPEPLAALRFESAWVEQAAWSPDGSLLAAAAGRRVRILKSDGVPLQELDPLPSTVTALTWDRDGKELLTASYGRVQRWDAASRTLREPLPWKTSLISVAISPDRRWIVAGTQEQSIQLWEMPYRPGGELAMSGYPGKVRNLAWHYSSRYLATDGGPEAMVWDCGGRGPAGTTPRILQGHSRRITVLAYQRAGHLLATGGEDGQVLLWNAGKSSAPVHRYVFEAPITSLAWNRSDTALAIGTRAGVVAVAKLTSER
ncbi:MAG: WD40 repeat domain-containing protein [Verrucomicrobiae bacterium]|nr:WD40 repeat domain-containing protein [Verrucomicrobiae bacterium]